MTNQDWQKIWWEKEKKLLVEASENLVKRGKFEIKCVFPELNFKEPYGSWFSDIPLHVQIPFMKKLWYRYFLLKVKNPLKIFIN